MKPHIRLTNKGKVVKVAVKENSETPEPILNEPRPVKGKKLPDAVIITSSGVRRAWNGSQKEDNKEKKNK